MVCARRPFRPTLFPGLRCVNGGAGKIFTAETAEMIGVNDHPEQSLRSPRAYSWSAGSAVNTSPPFWLGV